MELTRRHALSLLAAALAAPLVPVLERTRLAPPSVVEAVRGLADRAGLRPLDPRAVSRPGRWAG